MTQKDELAEAQTKITGLETKLTAAEGLQAKLDTANTNLLAAEKSRDFEKLRADTAEKKVETETARAVTAEGALKTATTRAETAEALVVTEKARAEKAENDVKTGDARADTRHAEQLAARGIKPFKKEAAGNAHDPKPAKPTAAQLHAQYEAFEDADERYAFFEKNKEVLMG